jgi:5,10-methylenetetrahydromethanopterin reductase
MDERSEPDADGVPGREPPMSTRSSVNIISDAPVSDVVALAVEAERLGFDRCWVYDEGLVTRDVYVVLAAIAAATTTIALGPGITNPYTRHPATTASCIATLDEYSNGRALLGIGAGGSLTLDPLGIARTKPLVTVRDTIRACRSLFAGERVDLVNDTFELRGAANGFATRPDIEIWLAGRGPKMLYLGGAVCDGVMLDFIHKRFLGDYVAHVRSGAAETGNSVQISYSTMIVTDDMSLATAKPHLTYRIVDSPPEVKAALGVSDAASDRIRSAMAGGLDAWVTPFVIHGTRRECRTEIENLCDRHGFNEFLLPVLELHGAADAMRAAAAVLA